VHRFCLCVTGSGDIERFANDIRHQLNGESLGAGAGIGTFLTTRWSIEFDGTMPRTIDTGLQVQRSQGTAGGLTMARILRRRTQLSVRSRPRAFVFRPGASLRVWF
jgi:hypothetical protein